MDRLAFARELRRLPSRLGAFPAGARAVEAPRCTCTCSTGRPPAASVVASRGCSEGARPADQGGPAAIQATDRDRRDPAGRGDGPVTASSAVRDVQDIGARPACRRNWSVRAPASKEVTHESRLLARSPGHPRRPRPRSRRSSTRATRSSASRGRRSADRTSTSTTASSRR